MTSNWRPFPCFCKLRAKTQTMKPYCINCLHDDQLTVIFVVLHHPLDVLGSTDVCKSLMCNVKMSGVLG